ncbi:hypothetical protein TRVA0_085S00254 [Trichomonascus vanleenenianus]|uniref:uncharacterized protein n=1 Tax=Trichomonascus vanleenenianus TaxID=2268995 RepID=UPI003ECADF96
MGPVNSNALSSGKTPELLHSDSFASVAPPTAFEYTFSLHDPIEVNYTSTAHSTPAQVSPTIQDYTPQDKSNDKATRKHSRSSSTIEPPATLTKKQSRLELGKSRQLTDMTNVLPEGITATTSTYVASTPSFDKAPNASFFKSDSKDFICIISTAGSVQYTSPTVESLLGLPLTAMAGKPFSGFLLPTDRDRFNSSVSSAIKSSSQFQLAAKLVSASGDSCAFTVFGRPYYDDAVFSAKTAANVPASIASGPLQQENCRGLVLSLRPASPALKPLPEFPLSTAEPPTAGNLWMRRQAARKQKSKAPPTPLIKSPIVDTTSSVAFVKASTAGHYINRPASAAPALQTISVNSPPEPVRAKSTATTPLTVSSRSTLAAPSLANSSTASLLSPTCTVDSSGVIVSTELDYSVPASATTLNSSIQSAMLDPPYDAMTGYSDYFEEPMTYPHSATAAFFDSSSHNPGWIPHDQDSYGVYVPTLIPHAPPYGRSYSFAQPSGSETLHIVTVEDSSFSSSNSGTTASTSNTTPILDDCAKHANSVATTPIQYRHSTSTGGSFYQLPGAANSSTGELNQITARVSLEDSQDPLSGAYWDNTTNSELVSPQYYQQGQALIMHSPARVLGSHAPSGLPRYLDPSTQVRGKSYSLPNALDSNVLHNPSRYHHHGISPTTSTASTTSTSQYHHQGFLPSGSANSGGIDFSGYSLSVKKKGKKGGYGMAKPRRKSKHHEYGVDSYNALTGETTHVCAECGAMESPEWRKGPKGPKTLCNACGLRWAKKTRKEEEQTASRRKH